MQDCCIIIKINNFEFGEFCLEAKQKILLRHGKPVSLTPKTLQLLFILIENNGQPIKKIKYPDPTARMLEIAWLPDGESLVYVLTHSQHANYSLWQQPFDEGKPPQKLADLGSEEVTSLAVALDGKSYLIIQGNWKNDAAQLKGLK